MKKKPDIDKMLQEGWEIGYKVVRQHNKQLVSYIAGCNCDAFGDLKASRYSRFIVTNRKKNCGPLGICCTVKSAWLLRNINDKLVPPCIAKVYMCLFKRCSEKESPYYQNEVSMNFYEKRGDYIRADAVMLLKPVPVSPEERLLANQF